MLKLSECSNALGRLEGMLRFVPNAKMYLTMYVRKEALLSAQIEGTQCTFDDVLNPELPELAEKDVADVVAYVRATKYAIRRMKELPLCTRLFREIHSELLRDTRGSDKNPGEMRRSQNWVGPVGCTISEAEYVPPNVEDMHDALSDLEKFINEKSSKDPIVKAALVHYQFETIHPFLDGNGRLGRLLIMLSLMNDGVLTKASFYPSYQLKVRRGEYYQRLMGVHERGEYAAWVEFFCSCLSVSAHDASETLERLSDLHEEAERMIDHSLGRSGPSARRLLSLLEANPIVRVSFIADRLGVSNSTANNLVSEFIKMGILRKQDASKQRYRVFVYEDYLALLRKGDQPLS
ncbi:MAG: Fic family protein [Coriobacteriales bacterium]|jgi:Fic family protein